MYCRKCGKKIDYDAEMCVECQENEELFTREDEQPAPQPAYDYAQSAQRSYAPAQEDRGSRMYGFGLALAAVIVSEFAIGFTYGMLAAMLGSGWLGAILVLLPMSIGMAVFTLIAGIKSVKRYIACSNAGKVKPIPTLILGIVAIVMSGLNFLLILISLGAIA